MDTMQIALVIVDMQNDFIHEEGFVSKSSHKIGLSPASLAQMQAPIPFIRKLADCFRKKKKPVIYIYTAWEADYIDVALPLGKMAGKAREMGALVKGNWGAEIIDELHPQDTDYLVEKKSYGGFFQTPLDRMLRNLGVKTLVMTGVATNFCVETTAREAVAYGYDVILVSDATATFDPEGHQATLKVIRTGFGDVMDTEEVLKNI